MELQALTPQQAAIQQVRVRYERGELPFEAFRRALDALLLAQNAEECQAVLRELPTSSLAPLAALDAPVPMPVEERTLGWRWVVAIIGEAKKMRRPWQLARRTLATAFIGEVRLDLTLAALPPRAVIRAAAVIGAVTLYVPRSAHVSVRGLALIGEVDALGEKAGGIVSFTHEEHTPATLAETTLEIQVLALIGEVKVVIVDGPVLSAARAARPRALAQPE